MTTPITLGRSPAMDIAVTQDVIDDAIARNSSHCVIAEAVRAHLRRLEERSNGKVKFGNVAVDLQTIRFSSLTKKERYTYLSPRSTQLCLINFDQGTKPKPFTFRLRTGQTTVRGHPASYNEKRRLQDAARALDGKQQEQKEVAAIVQSAASSKAPKASMRKPVKGSDNSVPEKVGGRPPPVSIGLRRAFGLRALDR